MKESLLDIIDSFNKNYTYLKSKLPYSFNLLDEVKANENAHSKILKKLIAYKEGDEYPFLNSFVESVGFGVLSSRIKNPRIYAEKDRIDISIKDDDYAIIIENKIHNAPDQGGHGGQVNRYYEIVKAKYAPDKIFVLYLTRSGGAPSKKSLSEEIKKELDDNYKSISYKNNILPWIEQDVLSICRYQNSMLISGIEQYIDHLKGIFKIRKNMKDMNFQLEKDLEEKLTLNKELSLEDKVVKINEIKDGISTFVTYLERTKVNYLSEISKEKFTEYISKWQDLFQKFPDNKIKEGKDEKGYWWIGVEMKYNGSRFLCGIGYDNISEQQENHLEPYFGVTCRPDYKEKDIEVANFVKKYTKGSFVKTTNWYVQKRIKFENVFDEFEKYFEEVQKNLEASVIKK